jgi:Domain of unknown function (DUF1735)
MKNNILKLGFLAICLLSFGSCLKDKGFDNNEYQSLGNAGNQKVVSVALSTDARDSLELNVSVKSVPSNASAVTIDLIPITLSGGVTADQDIHVVVDTIFSLVDNYNNYSQYSTTAPPDPVNYFDDPTPIASFSIVSKTVTIPKGQTTGYVQVRLIPNNFIGFIYGLGVKIKSVDGGYIIASNRKGEGIGGFAVVNDYEADYSSTGNRLRYAGPTLSGTPTPTPFADYVKHFSTAGAIAIKGGLADGGSGVTVILNTNLSTGIVTITSAGGTGGSTPSGTVINDPANISTYDPISKTFKLYAYYYNAAGNLRITNEILVRK